MLKIEIALPPDLEREFDAAFKLVERPAAALRELGRTLSNATRDHFDVLNKIPNARGFKKSGFWRGIKNGTYFKDSDDSSATVAIADETRSFYAKVHGAVITPKNAQALAIPVSEEAYGKSPRAQDASFKDALKLIPRKGKPSILATVDADGEIDKVHYVLLKRVKINPDPHALPRDEYVFRRLFESLSDYLERRGA